MPSQVFNAVVTSVSTADPDTGIITAFVSITDPNQSVAPGLFISDASGTITLGASVTVTAAY